jgi:hypothetical protein
MTGLNTTDGVFAGRGRRAFRDLGLGLTAALSVAACSGEPNAVHLRPPAEWRASLEQTARRAAGEARGVSEEVLRRSPAITGPALAQAIRFSRAQALTQAPEPMPDPIRTALAPYFSDDILEGARWTTAGHDLGLGSILARWYYEEGAVTLQDVIVFSDAAVARNVWLWAHELAHMEQYRRLGTQGFAARYAADWRALEAEANRRAFAITADIRARRAARPSPVAAVMDTLADMLDLSAPGEDAPVDVSPPAANETPAEAAETRDSLG